MTVNVGEIIVRRDDLLVDNLEVGMVFMHALDPRIRRIVSGYAFRTPYLPSHRNEIRSKWKYCLKHIFGESEQRFGRPAESGYWMSLPLEETPVRDYWRWAYHPKFLTAESVASRTKSFERTVRVGDSHYFEKVSVEQIPEPRANFIRSECVVPLIACMIKKPYQYIIVAMTDETLDQLISDFQSYSKNPSATFFYCNPYSATSASNLLHRLLYGRDKPTFWSADWYDLIAAYGILYRMALQDKSPNRLLSVKAALARIIVVRLRAGLKVPSVFQSGTLDARYLDWTTYRDELTAI